MEETDKQILEGLLRARSRDLRRPRRSRGGRPVPVPVPSPDVDDRVCAPAEAAARPCAECGEPIPPARLRAMPHAVLCLDCRRAAEASEAQT